MGLKSWTDCCNGIACSTGWIGELEFERRTSVISSESGIGDAGKANERQSGLLLAYLDTAAKSSRMSFSDDEDDVEVVTPLEEPEELGLPLST